MSIADNLYHRGSVRAGAMGAIAPFDFQKTPFAPVDFPKPFRKERKLGQFFTGLGSWDNYMHPSFETNCGAPG